jgi:radical SAM/SPASM domain protein of ACGX system
MSRISKYGFVLQWHLTAICDQSCVHCYVNNSATYEREIKKELSHTKCLRIIDDFSETFNEWGMPSKINFTGGDPLLRDDIFELIAYARNKGLSVGILGNPNHLNNNIALELKNLAVDQYQVSLDGLEETHDRLRGRRGLFNETLKAINILNKVGLPAVVMFTLSKENVNELIEVIKLVVKEGASVFDFARAVPIGSGEQLIHQLLSAQEYRDILLEVLDTYRALFNSGCSTYFGRKDHLWTLLYQELGLTKPLPKDKVTIFGGCGVGSSILTILSDGTVQSCRRLPVSIGKVPEQKIKDIFLDSDEQNKMRQVNQFQKCGKCELIQFCRGCPAVAYAVHGSYFAPDPQCWKEIM